MSGKPGCKNLFFLVVVELYDEDDEDNCKPALLTFKYTLFILCVSFRVIKISTDLINYLLEYILTYVHKFTHTKYLGEISFVWYPWLPALCGIISYQEPKNPLSLLFTVEVHSVG